MYHIRSLGKSVLKKMKYTIVPIGLALAISLSGCTTKGPTSSRNDTPTTPRPSTQNEQTYTPNSSTPSNELIIQEQPETTTPSIGQATSTKKLEEAEEIILSEEFRISQDSNNTLQNFISSIHVDYPYANRYGIDEALAKYYSVKHPTITSNEIINNGVINSGFYDAVKRNNEEYFQGEPFLSHKEMDKSVLTEITSYIRDYLNKLIKENPDIDLNVLDYTLKNLIIVQNNSAFGNAGVEFDQPLLWVNLGAIENSAKNTGLNALKINMEHEATHLVKQNYLPTDTYTYNFGLAYYFDELINNPLFWASFNEGICDAARAEIEESVGFYYNNVKEIDAMVLATILKPDVEHDTVEKIGLQRDLDKFFDLFGADTMEEKREVISMMFAYELINPITMPLNDPYIAIIGEGYKMDDRDALKVLLKASVAQTLTKIFYTNLVDLVSTKNVELRDIFNLMSVMETEFNRISRFTYEKEANVESLQNYHDIRYAFLMTLSQNSEYSVDELETLFIAYDAAYHSQPKTALAEVDIEVLSETENRFILHMVTSREGNRTAPIE